MKTTRISLIHATPLAIQPVNAAFARLWPEAQCHNLLDDRLTTDLLAAGQIDQAMITRMVGLANYGKTHGAAGILFTCSAFGPAIDAAKAAVGLPILKPNEAMFAEALTLCRELGGARRIGLLTTFAPAGVSMREELLTAIAAANLPITVDTACAVGAMEAYSAGEAAEHDRRVLEQAQDLAACDVVLLGQFSMAHCQAAVASALNKPVLTSPDSAVRAMRALVEAAT
jgi:Asp/Glu/hydantoin racemase